MKRARRRALFAISSLGLGHATRSLAVINEYLADGWAITVVSSGTALALLRSELGGNGSVSFIEMDDYPPLERGTGWRHYWFLLVDLLATWRVIRREHRQLQAVEAGHDFIFSDGRYGFYSRHTPCFILTHQIAFMPPPLLKKTFWLTRYANLCALRRFDTILIPDYPSAEANLSGGLSHSPLLVRHRHRYVGILSSYRPRPVEPDIDYLFVISGYLLEHKDAFIRNLVLEADRLPGRKVFILGQQDSGSIPEKLDRCEKVEIHEMVDGEQRQQLFNRSRTVIARAGYTTIMDLVEHGKRGLLIPTPNQTEQEYLARLMARRGYFVTARQGDDIDLPRKLAASEAVNPLTPPWKTSRSVSLVKSAIEPLIGKSFISLIVPAHNEEAELEATLRALLDQDYPADRFEIIVVENGSTDSTAAVAATAAGLAGDRRLTVLRTTRGVSRAKNLGLAHTDPASEWVVFCDADTHLGPRFLNHLNTRLKRDGDGLSVGTCAIKPRRSAGWYQRAWFTLYDLIHRVTKSSYALQIARTTVARRIGFDAELDLAEDLLFIRECRRQGRFFFLSTDQVATSTRRFDSVGYLRLSLGWLIGALLPVRLRQRLKYHVIR